MKIAAILCLTLMSLSASACEFDLLTCTGFQYGDFDKVTVTQTCTGDTYFRLHSGDDFESTTIDEAEYVQGSLELPPVGIYTRKLVRKEDKTWEIAWSCGDSTPIDCQE